MTPIVITKTKTDATSRHTLVANDIQYEEWDVKRIEKYLNKIGLNGEAKEIAKEVEQRIFNTNSKYITTKLIREICDTVLFERGLLKGDDLLNLSVPVEDIETFLFDKSNENSNMSSHNPEATAFFLSGLIAKQYAFQKVFSKKIVDAHKKGQIYIHDLDMVWRAYCSVHSPALVLKHGLNIPDLNIKSAPPRNCRALIGQICSFLASMQAYYAGAMALGYVNTFFAPLTKDLSDKELEQSMQHFIFQLSQTAFSRGAQTLFVDLNLYIETPSYLKDIKAIGKGGKELDITYGELEDEAHRILRAVFKIAKQGDAEGKPFFFPKLCLHISKRCFENEKYKALLLEACDVASVNGSIYFIFDYVDTQLAACCRLRADVDKHFLENPLEIRFCGVQNVSINFPQIGYRLKNTSTEAVIKEVKKMADLCILAHKQKKRFLKRLMKDGCMRNVGLPLLGLKEAYLDLDKATYIIGIIGLNDLMHCIRGKNMHEDETVFLEALQIISELENYLNEKSKEIGMKLVLEESPAESSLPFDEQILVYDGKYKFYKIGEFVERFLNGEETSKYIGNRNILVPSFNRYTQKIELKRVLKVMRHLPKCIYTIKLRGGKKVRTTGDHSIFVMNKSLQIVEKRTDELKKGDFIVVAKKLNCVGNKYLYCSDYLPKNLCSVSLYNHIDFLEKNEEELKRVYTSRYKMKWKDIKCQLKKQNVFKLDLISHLISNEDIEYIKTSYANKIKNKILLDEDFGYLLGFVLAEGSKKSIANTNPKYIEKIENIITEKFGDGSFFKQIRKDTRKKQYKTAYSLILNKTLAILFKQFKITECQLVRDIDTSLLVSEDVCRGIVRGYIDGDGSITHSKQKGDYNIRLYTISSLLKDKLTLILKLLGIDYKLYIDRKSKVKENWHDCFVISVFGRENIAKLIDIGININNKGRADSIPYIATIIKKIINTYTYPYWRNVLGYDVHNDSIWVDARQGYINRHKATKLLYKFRTIPIIYQQFGAIIEKMIHLLKCDLMFEKVESIEKSKEIEPVYDISVEGNENFIGGEGFICLHNSSKTLAQKDLQQFEKAKGVVRGTLENPYYTNSIHFIPEADISLIERIRKQSMFHQFIRGGAIIHAFVGEELPPATSIYNLLQKVFEEGNCQQLVFSPEFTICSDCKKTVLGMLAKCEFCGSDNIYNVTRIVGYYSRVQDWHNSKKEELKARQRGNYK